MQGTRFAMPLGYARKGYTPVPRVWETPPLFALSQEHRRYVQGTRFAMRSYARKGYTGSPVPVVAGNPPAALDLPPTFSGLTISH